MGFERRWQNDILTHQWVVTAKHATNTGAATIIKVAMILHGKSLLCLHLHHWTVRRVRPPRACPPRPRPPRRPSVSAIVTSAFAIERRTRWECELANADLAPNSYDINLPLASIPERLRRPRPSQLQVPSGMVHEPSSGAGLAQHGRLAAAPMRSDEVLASVSGLVGEEDVGRTPAQLSVIGADAFRSREGNGPN